MSSNKASQELIQIYKMSQRSQVSRVALCMLESKGRSLSDSVKWSPIDWKAKKGSENAEARFWSIIEKLSSCQDVGDCLLACYEQMLRDARGKITLISFDKLPYPIWASTTWLSFANRVNKITISKCQFIISSSSVHSVHTWKGIGCQSVTPAFGQRAVVGAQKHKSKTELLEERILKSF